MFSTGINYNKLKTNLRLAANRLKLLGKKKTELAQKARKEIADYIADFLNGCYGEDRRTLLDLYVLSGTFRYAPLAFEQDHKEDRARIKVEMIIREDYLVEAYELLEMYCDLILARFGLIQQMKTIDEGIEEAINSVLWAAPRLVADVQEFKPIADLLLAKYGKPYVEACRENKFGKVSPKLLQKLSVQAPPKILVEKYMTEIAKSHGVPFTPDEIVMRDDEVAAAEAMLIDFQNKGQQGYGWNYPPGPPEQNVPVMEEKPVNPHASYGYPGPPAPAPSAPFAGLSPTSPGFAPIDQLPPPGIPGPAPGSNIYPPASGFSEINFPDLPEPPTTIGRNDSDGKPFPPPPPTGGTPNGSGGTDSLDFDDLTRRFEELKKKK